MDSIEFEITGVIEKAKKLSQRKQSNYSNFPFWHSPGGLCIHIQMQEVAAQMALVILSLIHPF